MYRHPHSRENGIALIMVLWTLTLVTVMAGSFSLAMRTELQLASNLADRTRGAALAEGGIRIGIARLLEPDEERRWAADGTEYIAAIGGEPVRVSLQSEHGLVDLNRAPDALLRALLNGVLPDGEQADAATDALLDWRDANRSRRVNGAEDPAYERAGRRYGARDGPFISVHELTQILGISASVAKELKPLLTVNSGRPTLDPGVAPRAVLINLPGASEAEVDQYIDSRHGASNDGPTPVPPQLTSADGLLGPATAPRRPTSGTFTVVARANVGAARVQRSVVVRTRLSRSGSRRGSRQGAAPFTILAWSDELTPSPEAGVPSDLADPGAANVSKRGQ